jgi:hypothetical protein
VLDQDPTSRGWEEDNRRMPNESNKSPKIKRFASVLCPFRYQRLLTLRCLIQDEIEDNLHALVTAMGCKHSAKCNVYVYI